MPDSALPFITALLLGLGSSAHCMGMCGGIACALGLQSHPKPTLALLLYHTGRLLAYAVIALLLGGVLQHMQALVPSLTLWLRTTAALLLIAMALQTLRVWHGILVLEKIGARLWQPVQNIAKTLLPVRHTWQLLALGFLWGWLPCALVYSTLAWAVSQGDALQAASLMLAFGAGTAPVLLISGLAANRVKTALQQPAWRYSMAVLLILCAVWTLYGTWQHAAHQHAGHDHMQHEHQQHKH